MKGKTLPETIRDNFRVAGEDMIMSAVAQDQLAGLEEMATGEASGTEHAIRNCKTQRGHSEIELVNQGSNSRGIQCHPQNISEINSYNYKKTQEEAKQPRMCLVVGFLCSSAIKEFEVLAAHVTHRQ